MLDTSSPARRAVLLPEEKRAAVSVATLIALRMYGLFLIMPVFSVYAKTLPHSTPVLIGLALGVYGLTQALLQVPMGLLSDLFGRKPVLTAGLLLFIAGSIVAATATSIHIIVIGRAIQGMGAIASVGMALVADISREVVRGRVMAVIGMSIGAAFMLAFVTGPVLYAVIGMSGLFWLTALLAMLALLQLHVFVKEPPRRKRVGFSWRALSITLRNPVLLSLDLSVFVLHAVMTAVFVALPLALNDELHFLPEQHGRLYLPVLVLSVGIMLPLIIGMERSGRHIQYIWGGLLGLAVSQWLLPVGFSSLVSVAAVLVLFFGMFNFLEAGMPAWLSRLAGEKYRGAAMGMYSSSQFFGAFAGSILAGYLMHYGYTAVFWGTGGLVFLTALLVWLVGRSRGVPAASEV